MQYIEQGWKDSGKELVKNKEVKRQVQFKEEQEKQILEQKESEEFKAYNKYVSGEILKVIDL